MTRAWALTLVLTAGAAPAAEERLFLGHYGTSLRYPLHFEPHPQFGRDGIEVILLSERPGSGADYAVLIFPKATRPNETLQTLAAEVKGSPSVESGRGWRLLTRGRMAFYLRDGPEYLYRVSGPDRAMVLKIAHSIRQEPRLEWERKVIEARRREDGAEAFVPDLRARRAYSSRLGYRLVVPDGYIVHEKLTERGEVLYLFPRKHGVLMNLGILQDASYFDAFDVIQFQAADRKVGAPKDILEGLSSFYRRRYGLAPADVEVRSGRSGSWVLERHKPSYLRYVAWDDGALVYQVTGVDARLTDSFLSRVSRGGGGR